jgi:drug/metabolite transporter (DMT)-like permease
MPPLTVALLLLAAFLHASWNTILRAGADRLWSITIMGLVGGAAALVVAAFLPLPAAASWPFIAISSVLQVGYSLFLVRAYRDGHLAHVYPVARGVAPVLVTLGAWLVAGERPTPPALLGVGLVSSGIMTLAFGRDRPDARTLAAALATGGFVAAYMVNDGVGVRLSSQAIAYAAWLTIFQAAGMLAAFAGLRRRLPDLPRGREGLATTIAALIGSLGYGIALWAMSGSPMSQVSALRETSILFAAVMGAVLLREPLTARRILGGASIAAGAICLAAF